MRRGRDLERLRAVEAHAEAAAGKRAHLPDAKAEADRVWKLTGVLKLTVTQRA
jgi:hypothetical protein